MRYFVPLIYIVIGAVLFYFVYPKKTKVVTVYKQYKPPKGFVLVNKVELDSLNRTVNIKSDSIRKLVKKYKETVSLVIALKVELDSVKRVNLAPTDTTDTTYTYSDSLVIIEFNTKRKRFGYFLKPYPFYIDVATFGDTLLAVDVSHYGQTVRKFVKVAKPIAPNINQKPKWFGGAYLGLFVSRTDFGPGLGLSIKDYFGSVYVLSSKSLGFSLMKRL